MESEYLRYQSGLYKRVTVLAFGSSARHRKRIPKHNFDRRPEESRKSNSERLQSAHVRFSYVTAIMCIGHSLHSEKQ
jgi:hypothetical protein